MRRPGRKVALTDAEIGDANHSYAYAITLLARRDYSTRELRSRLKERGYLEHAIEPVLIDLEETRKLDDARYGANVVASRSRRALGPARIRQELTRKGVTAQTIDQALAGGDGEVAPDFIQLARQARARKFGPELPTDWKERSRQARFLQYRGFSNDHIRAVLEGDPELDSEPDSGSEPDPS
jgi:regulatory protein